MANSSKTLPSLPVLAAQSNQQARAVIGGRRPPNVRRSGHY
ncbi:MAG: hypothetical protein Q8J93_06830 [Xanthomonadales bacterium]|nr:hypothetical protein [Xanthomonadales bacterium]MDZ4116694.1 hypothetical protein [Xanthomonadaceae bacterium]MDZ4376576.1 hypothetical protein [Xanthomonadaceae bacterium]